MNKITKLLAVVFLCVASAGILSASDFRFGTNGKFKIVQVTDSHIIAGSDYSKETVEMLRQVLDAEKPDLVIFTGDIVTGKPYKAGFGMVVEPVVTRKIPWALLFGNHDDEQDMTREQLAGFIQSYPYNAGQMKKVKNVSGYGNYVLEVKGADNKKVTAVLYCMDSNAYSRLKPLVDGYGWFAFDQVEWYRRQSSKYTSSNGGKPLPALAFFHIPLPEYHAVTNEGNRVTGAKLEEVCSPKVNSGMFLAMLEKGDVMGTFVGHDHVNDYIFNHHGIALTYGRFSGSKNTYGDMKNGEIGRASCRERV